MSASQHSVYNSPLNERYASKEMQYLFSEEKSIRTWRKIWIAIAKSQKELGLNISDEQIKELEEYEQNINFDVAREYESQVRHDVMAHILAYGEQAKSAKPIIHLGATSCTIKDNAEIIIMDEALKIIRNKLINLIDALSKFALEYKSLPTLGFTHLQPAQLTTVGKRACLWIQDLLMDLEDIEYYFSHNKLRGVKGTTGTQASFLNLFEGDHEKVNKLDKLVAEKLGYDRVFAITGQTYPRKLDKQILSILSGISQSAYKFSNDIRLLQGFKEVDEPFGKAQVGSSAMPYKQNPMRSERISSLARLVICTELNPSITASTQWFERTLDDSANRRITISESFLASDAILDIYLNVVKGLVVYPEVIHKRIMSELPFMATETILMECVKRGGDRQELHERLRVHSLEAGHDVKMFGKENNLIERITNDNYFNLTENELNEILNPMQFIGRSPEQVDEFISEFINPILEENKDILGAKAELSV